MTTPPVPRPNSDPGKPSAPVAASAPAEDEPEELTEFVEELPAVPARKRRRRKLVLIGAGHAHLQILEWWREKPIRGVDLKLISSFPQAVYSGMLPSVLAGQLDPAEMQIDLARLASRCDAELILDKVVGLDPETRTLELAVHPEQNFDLASINVGAGNVREDLCQTHRVLVAVKPLATFLSRFEHRLQELLLQYRDAPGTEYLQLAVVGGGAAGVELALCLEERAHREGWHAEIRLIEAKPDLLTGYAPRTVRLVKKLLKRRGISVHLGSPVLECDEDGPPELILENGDRLRIDLAVWAAGAAPPGLLRGYPLSRSPSGYLAVQPTLQTVDNLPIFACGDVAEIMSSPCPKAGVYAVRQAKPLWINLQRWCRGGDLVDYVPQPQFLSLLSCGDGTAILNYGRWGMRSSWMWRLKRRIDRRFIRRFQ